ncbi:MAG TPA: hypothetical protein VLT61_11835, partial [Anaeromyxobacteraceae bacterium]|nr:hypothetical protein [Anaeromyxobacteraceae bacterium]
MRRVHSSGVAMRLRQTIAILLAAVPMAGAPQGLEGLDFSAPRKKPPADLPPPSDADELPAEPAEAPPPQPEPAA